MSNTNWTQLVVIYIYGGVCVCVSVSTIKEEIMNSKGNGGTWGELEGKWEKQ